MVNIAMTIVFHVSIKSIESIRIAPDGTRERSDEIWDNLKVNTELTMLVYFVLNKTTVI